jgi:hypothetical protein
VQSVGYLRWQAKPALQLLATCSSYFVRVPYWLLVIHLASIAFNSFWLNTLKNRLVCTDLPALNLNVFE